MNNAYPSCNLHQNLIDELANVTHRFQVSQLLNDMSEFMKNIVLTEDDLLEHRWVELEKRRREIVKTTRFAEMPEGFWDRAGIRITDGLPHFLATPEFTEFALLQQAFERKVDGGGNAKFQQALTLAIEAATGGPPADKKNPLQELSPKQVSKVMSLISASVEKFGLNCNAPSAARRDYGERSPAQSMPSSGGNAFMAHGAKSSGTSGNGRPNRFVRSDGGASGGTGSGGASGGKGKGGKGGQNLTAEQRTASRERSKERRAQTVASNLKDSENLKRYDETARATDPSNNFKHLKSCAQKLNGEFRGLNKKTYGTKFMYGPFKIKNEDDLNDIEVIWPLEMSFGSLYEFASKGRGNMNVKCPTSLYVRAAAIMDAARLGPGGYLSSWGEAYSSLKELSKGTNWEKNTRDFANSLRPGTVPLP